MFRIRRYVDEQPCRAPGCRRRQAEQAAPAAHAAGPGAGTPVPTATEPPRRRGPARPAPRDAASATPTAAAAARPPRQAPKAADAAARAARGSTSRSGSTSSRATCTPSCSSSSARTSTPPTSTRPTSSSRVRQVLGDVLARQDRPISNADRGGSPRRSATTSWATARSSPSCATRTSPRSWSTATTSSTWRRTAGCAGRGAVQRRGAPAPHDRQDRVPHRPPRRRVQPDGRRPAPRRQPCQRGHPAAGDRRLLPDHPQVRRPTR